VTSDGNGGKSVSIQKAAELLNKSQQFVRVGLQRGILPFGSAVKLSTKWTYYISPARFYDYAGLEQKRA
jgi:hypothetical protein